MSGFPYKYTKLFVIIELLFAIMVTQEGSVYQASHKVTEITTHLKAPLLLIFPSTLHTQYPLTGQQVFAYAREQ